MTRRIIAAFAFSFALTVLVFVGIVFLLLSDGEARAAVVGPTANGARMGEGDPCASATQPEDACGISASNPLPVPVPDPEEDPEPGFLIAQVRPGSSVAVRSAPGGPVVTRLGSRTEFGSRRSLSVVARRGHWLGVGAPELGNGRLGWIDTRVRTVAYARTKLRIEIDLSRRELLVRRGDEAARRFPISVGAPGSPTPLGRFAVTDKLPGARYSSAYGCCILALSGRQPHLPGGWTGGDRLAIHGSPGGAHIGRAESAGCLRAREPALRTLMRIVPLGTPVVIHP